MTDNTPSDERALATFSALQDWLSQDEQGKQLVVRFLEDPQVEAPALKQWLQTHSNQAPPQLATYITGGHIDNLVNIARSETVNIAHASAVVYQRFVLPGRPTALNQLPADIPNFTGRGKEMADLAGLLQPAAGNSELPVRIAVVTGMAGVGKSALAIHAAHRLKDSFPDAQLYRDLRNPDGKPVETAEVLAGFLRAFGVEDRFIPLSLGERAGLYRSLLAEKRALVLLDNAHDEVQVRSLLPASSTCAVLITSRNSLSALEDASSVSLDVLYEDEAIELLGKLAGPDRVLAEPAFARQIVQLCECLPLAVRIAGGKLRAKQHWPLAHYVLQLIGEQTRLQQLELGDLQLRASFDLTYRDLRAENAHAFRLLGMLPGADFAQQTAAAVLGTNPDQSLDIIENLVDMQLLEPSTRGRYRFQHLVRFYAVEQLRETEPTEVQAAARSRVAHLYLRMSGVVSKWLDVETKRQEAQRLAALTKKTPTETENDLFRGALDWFESERPELLTSVYWAYYGNEDEVVWRIAAHMIDFAQIQSHREEWEQILLLALMAARRVKYRPAEALALTNLGILYRSTGKLEEAEDLIKRAIAIYTDLGEKVNLANNLNNLGTVYLVWGQARKAEEMFNQALAIDTELGRKKGLANDFGNLANLYAAQGNFQGAEEMYAKALTVAREINYLEAMANTLNNLGTLYGMQDNLPAAEAMFRLALPIEMGLGRKEGIAANYGNLGNIHLSRNELDDAERYFRQALTIDQELGLMEGAANNLTNLGIVYQNRGQLDTAEEMYRNSLALEEKLGRKKGIADSCYNLGLLYETTGKVAEARALYEQARDTYLAVGAADEAGTVNTRLSGL